MEYTVACNWDPELIERIDFPEVKSLFGALPDKIISGGRPTMTTKGLDEEAVKNYIKRVHQKGWNFDFNINSSCLSNYELTTEGYREIEKYLEWVSSLNVDSLTISHTNLISIVKKRFPNLKIKVSTFQKISNVAQAQRFEDMGVDAIMLSEHVNRDIKLIKEIKKHVKCKLILLANVGCVYNCVNMHTHANGLAHSGSAGGKKTVLSEAYHTYCFQKRIESPSELVKIRWIRPEDVAYYEDAGVDMLKIIDRYSSTDTLVERMKAYSDRKYDGNIMNLIGQMMDKKHADKKVISSMMDLRGISDENIEKVVKYYSAFKNSLSDLFTLENSKLPKDFINNFANRDCNRLSCDKCGFCKKIADEAVSVIDERKLEDSRNRLIEVRGQLADGTILY